MKNIWSKIQNFLREQAVETVIAIITLIITIISLLGAFIAGWISNIFNWLTLDIVIKNWLFVLLAFLLVFFTSAWIIAKNRDSKRINYPNNYKTSYYKVWGVLWGWPPRGGRWIVDGPLCPKHKLPVDVIQSDSYRDGYKFDFHCPGSEGDDSHVISGPKTSQLVDSKGEVTRNVNIYKDVNARLKSKELKGEI